MPRPLIPHHSGVHRAACEYERNIDSSVLMQHSPGFALYRALLRQKKHLDPCKVARLGYDACIGKVFRRNSKVLGQEKATIALNLGYKVYQTFHSKLLSLYELTTHPDTRSLTR